MHAHIIVIVIVIVIVIIIIIVIVIVVVVYKLLSRNYVISCLHTCTDAFHTRGTPIHEFQRWLRFVDFADLAHGGKYPT